MAAHRHWQWLCARRAIYPHGPHHNEEGVGLAPMAHGAKGMTFEAGRTYDGSPADARAVYR